ncbi:DUF6946 family protein [Chloroflexota bacterium]
MSKFYIPSRKPQDWKLLLAKPRRHWKTGYSAKLLAYSWQEANDFPPSVKTVFNNSGMKLFKDIELLVAFPEWKVPLRGGKRASQSDIFILAKGNEQLISIMVEGKVRETFGEIVADWKLEDYGGKEERLGYLCNLLELDVQTVDGIRYQLLHRTASALIEAKRFNAKNAMMLVHSFSQGNEGFQDYCQFLSLFKLRGKINSLTRPKNISGIRLYFGWVSE